MSNLHPIFGQIVRDFQAIPEKLAAASVPTNPRGVGSTPDNAGNHRSEYPKTPNDCPKCGSGNCYCEIASNE